MGKRLIFGIEVGGRLALLSLPAVALMLYLDKAFEVSRLLVATTPATLSAFLIALTVAIMPDLAGDNRIRTPMNFAFPIIFAIVNLVVARALWFSPSVVEAPQLVLNPILIWLDPKMILLAFAFQVIALTISCRPRGD